MGRYSCESELENTLGNPRVFSSSRLANQVRQKSHEAGTLDREGEFTLMPAADAGALARDDLAEGGQVATKGVGILVVNVTHVDLTEVTGANGFLSVLWVWHKDKYEKRRRGRTTELLRGMNVRNEIKREYLRCEFLDHRHLCPSRHQQER